MDIKKLWEENSHLDDGIEFMTLKGFETAAATLSQQSSIPSNSICFFMDGDKMFCVHADFKNLQESPYGFGDSFDEAFSNLRLSLYDSSPQRQR